MQPMIPGQCGPVVRGFLLLLKNSRVSVAQDGQDISLRAHVCSRRWKAWWSVYGGSKVEVQYVKE